MNICDERAMEMVMEDEFNMEWVTAAPAIEAMRGAGMNDIMISCVIQDIHAASVHAERSRVAQLAAFNPPKFIGHEAICKLLHKHIQ